MLTAQKNPDMMIIVMVACLLAGSEFARLLPPLCSFTTEIIRDIMTIKIIRDISLILVILMLVQGVGGTISNALSLSYFLKKERETLASKLMILLNSIDLLICFSVLVIFFAAIFTGIIGSTGNVINSQLGLWFHFLVAATAFVTCLLSVTRTISLVYS